MDIFNVLAVPARRRILEILASQGQLSATDISGKFKVSGAAISQHLKVLREAGLIFMVKDGQQRLYQIKPGGMKELDGWSKRLERLWVQRFDSLDKLLKKEQKSKS